MTQNSFFCAKLFLSSTRYWAELIKSNHFCFFAVVFNTRRLHRLSDDHHWMIIVLSPYYFANFYARPCCAQDFYGKLPSLINLAPIELISYHKLDLMALFAVILVHCFPLSLSFSSRLLFMQPSYGYMCKMCERALDVCAKVINVDCFVASNMKTH